MSSFSFNGEKQNKCCIVEDKGHLLYFILLLHNNNYVVTDLDVDVKSYLNAVRIALC
jgi:hypothetical protein